MPELFQSVTLSLPASTIATYLGILAPEYLGRPHSLATTTTRDWFGRPAGFERRQTNLSPHKTATGGAPSQIMIGQSMSPPSSYSSLLDIPLISSSIIGVDERRPGCYTAPMLPLDECHRGRQCCLGCRRPVRLLLGITVLLAICPAVLLAQAPQATPPAPPNDGLMTSLYERVQREPKSASGWRLLGRALEKRGDLPGALSAFERAAALEPTSAAAQFDLGRLLAAGGKKEQAAAHLRSAMELAPNSSYAAQAAPLLQQISPADAPGVKPVSFEVDWQGGPPKSPLAESLAADDDPTDPLAVNWENGVLYNSNVQLSPISRELSSTELASVQAFTAPAFEYRWAGDEDWHASALLDSYFNINEGNFRAFNLQHLQPGLALEAKAPMPGGFLLPRLQYDMTYDAFDGATLGWRHALTASLTAREHRGHRHLIYLSVDHTNFSEDGDDPPVTSLDGWTCTFGIGQCFHMDHPWLSEVSWGVDGQWANLEGSTFTYRGVMLYGEAVVPVVETLELRLQGGLGYRDYPDFEFTPSRNETIHRAAAELRKHFSTCWYMSGLVTYDRFSAQNQLFDSSRYTAGISITYHR